MRIVVFWGLWAGQPPLARETTVPLAAYLERMGQWWTEERYSSPVDDSTGRDKWASHPFAFAEAMLEPPRP